MKFPHDSERLNMSLNLVVEIIFKDGKRLVGRLRRYYPNKYTIETKTGDINFCKSKVKKIEEL